MNSREKVWLLAWYAVTRAHEYVGNEIAAIEIADKCLAAFDERFRKPNEEQPK